MPTIILSSVNLNQIKFPSQLILFLLGLFTHIRQQISTCITEDFALTCLSRNKYLTNQVNYMVIIWLGIYIYWRNSEERLEKINGNIRGAITVYITLVWLAYWVLLSGDSEYVGWDLFTNIIVHFLLPIWFIIDWVLFERIEYTYSLIKNWSIYPIIYILFALLNGLLQLNLGYIYDFLNPDTNGWGWVWIMLLNIFISYLILALVYVNLNRRFLSKKVAK